MVSWRDVASSAEDPRRIEPSTSSVLARIYQWELRRRASFEEFASGVDLAEAHGVSVTGATADVVEGTVRDGRRTYHVEIVIEDGQLVSRCGCRTQRDCAHAVALAHLVWLRDRQPPYSEVALHRQQDRHG